MTTSTKQPVDEEFTIIIKGDPARKLRGIIRRANYTPLGPEQFIVNALDIFDCALKYGGGKIIVEDERRIKRYVFDIIHGQPYSKP